MKRIRRMVLAALAVFSLPACVWSPTTSQAVVGNEPVVFEGLTLVRGGTVRLEAFHQSDLQFEEILSATADSTPIFTPGTTPLYHWKITATIPACYWHSSCAIQPEDVHARLRVRVKRPNGSMTTLMTFGPNTAQCIADTQTGFDFAGLIVAYWQCKPDIFDEIALHWI